jgi:formylglycine-generating enzyme required for sulfatase activity
MQTPAAFISYARLDDHAYGGRITRLRERLEGMVGSAIGRRFRIFQDRTDIGWGQHWPSRLEEGLNEALFLIPILTPAYFNSDACRAELETFLELERRSERRDRILPLYFVTAPVFEQKSDPLAAALYERQWWNWRHLRVDSIGSQKVLRELDRLAGEVADAIHRMDLPAPPPPVVLGLDPRTQVSGSPGSAQVAEGRGSKLGPRVKPEDDNNKTAARGQVFIGDPGPDPAPGTIFKDLDEPWCPEMVVIPAGSFLMGSPETEQGRNSNEGPQHRVTFARPFALGRFPVTFEEYDGRYYGRKEKKPGDEGWGRGRRPVINVDWEDADLYCLWLRGATGQAYRLPSEAEWEYACRAGTTTPFWMGATISTDQLNYDGASTCGRGARGRYRGQTTPVDAFPPNPWGLYDIHGNVWEWCADRWHDTYRGAPTDGSPWLQGTDWRRVVRGGSWNSGPENVRSAFRMPSNFIDPITDYIVEQFKKEEGIDLRSEDRPARVRLKEELDKAKIELSRTTQSRILLPFIAATQTGAKHLDVRLRRAELEQLVDDLGKCRGFRVARTLVTC